MNTVLDTIVNLTLGSSKSASLSKKDYQDAIKYAVMGFVTAGSLHAASTLIQKRMDVAHELKHETTAMHHNPELTKRFVTLQTYAKLNKWAFQAALINVDSLLYLEDALLKKKIVPVYNDKLVAFSHFRVALMRLNSLALAIQNSMDQRHYVLVCLEIEEITKLLKKHVINILSLCSRFNVDDLIEQARTNLN